VISLSSEQVLFIHARLVDEAGGMHGVRDLGLLRSAVARPRAIFGGEDLYPDIFRKAAALMESLILNHPFLDGNKRTAISAAGLFLLRNGQQLSVTQQALEQFTMDMALKRRDIEDAANWFKKHTKRER
jgi:death on curing protein